MPCLFILAILGMPRLALFLLWLFGGDYLSRAYDAIWWPLLGFFFLPTTTIAFAYAMNGMRPVGGVSDLGWLLVGVAVILDLGLFGGSWQSRRGRARPSAHG